MRNFLNVTAHMLGQASGSNSMRNNRSCIKRARHDRNICSSSSKGVVALLSGNWAAHVYVNNHWIGIGIFETEKEAVIAYESTTIKIWIECCNRYSQRINSAAQEPITLKQASIDGTHSSSSVNVPQVHEKQKCIRTRLFEKVLTPSDVSKLNKIHIPKVYASCFPCVFNENESNSEVRPVNDVELAFYDRSMTLWKFRYCYWKRGNTYAFSRGWRKFVEAKQLRSKDKVIFFKCERVEATFIVQTYFMIDVEYYANRVQVEEVGDNMGEYALSSRPEFRSEGVHNLQNEQSGGGTADGRQVMKIEADKDLQGTKSGKAQQTSFKLFGVKIV